MLTLTRHYSHALRATRVFEGARKPKGPAVIQAHLYEHSDGVWTVHFEGYTMVPAFDGCLVPPPAGTEPWVTKGLELNPDIRDCDSEEFTAWLRNVARMTSDISIMDLKPAQHPALAPVYQDKPLRNSAEIALLDSPFWEELWRVIAFRTVPKRPEPSTWAANISRQQVANRLGFDAPELVFAWLIGFGADGQAEGPWAQANLALEDKDTFVAQLPAEVLEYLRKAIEHCQTEYVNAPRTFNELDLVNVVLTKIQAHRLVA